MRTGIATIPLDYGRCPRWLFERMRRLGRGIAEAIVEEFGPEEFLKRLSDPVWFQSLGCVMGFDWNSSGLTVTTLGALKAGLFEIQDRLGVYVCGGKRESRKTPEEIEAYGVSRQFSFAPQLIYASKMAAKVDSSLIQAGYQIYHHNFLFTKSGKWAIIQQGMNTNNQTARRYHWLSSKLKQTSNKKDFIEEPHTGIASQLRGKPLNLTAKKSENNREISLKLATETPKTFFKDLDLIQTLSEVKPSESKNEGKPEEGKLHCIKRAKNLTEMSLCDKEFHWHPVVEEKFDLKRLEKTIFSVKEWAPEDFEKMLSLKGIGPKTIRALSLVAEIIYGARPSYEDPARYSFSVGGKDGTPYPVDRETYDKTLEIMEKGIKNSLVSLREKTEAQKRLSRLI